jgi:hypothetical protein
MSETPSWNPGSAAATFATIKTLTQEFTDTGRLAYDGAAP